MFRLKATLIATTLMRPWRTGWSTDRGVDFSIAPTARPTLATPTARTDRGPAEPACFIDEDWAVPHGTAVVRTFVSSAAADAEPERGSEETTEAPGLRAWWSLASKPEGG